ncbi:hypothetical protein AC578_10868 [Pseudocercospora eumusae]|uniref:Uncharacterized protein n=1 Tax=Pseudocercospora eumusae TaxID=321146 RepID=A0A139H8T4_9PEZI|nr:hypothetical protein AC578_10868 [Pseudocercospora eumusae]
MSHFPPDLAGPLVRLGIRLGSLAIYVISPMALPRYVTPMQALSCILANTVAVACFIQTWFNLHYDLGNALQLLDARILCCTMLWGFVLEGLMIYGYGKFAYEVLARRWRVIWRTR